MKTVTTGRENLYDDENLHELLAGRLATANREVEEHESLVDVLPKLENISPADMGQMERLYAQKDKSEQKLRLTLARFEEYLPAIHAKLEAVEKNRGVSSEATRQIKHERPHEKLSEGERNLAVRSERLRAQPEAVRTLISRIQRVLAKSSAKRWPHGAPKSWGPV